MLCIETNFKRRGDLSIDERAGLLYGARCQGRTRGSTTRLVIRPDFSGRLAVRIPIRSADSGSEQLPVRTGGPVIPERPPV